VRHLRDRPVGDPIVRVHGQVLEAAVAVVVERHQGRGHGHHFGLGPEPEGHDEFGRLGAQLPAVGGLLLADQLGDRVRLELGAKFEDVDFLPATVTIFLLRH
jgi:hypothetical protein